MKGKRTGELYLSSTVAPAWMVKWFSVSDWVQGAPTTSMLCFYSANARVSIQSQTKNKLNMLTMELGFSWL
jgi:hypothetical protein